MDKLLSINNKKVAVSQTGSGKHLFFLHGFCESMAIWDDLAALFGKNYTITRIDLPGHGNSSDAGKTLSIDMMAEMVIQVCEHLGINETVLTGHSMGGYVSVAVAEKKPAMLRGLCMLHSSVYADSGEKQKDRNRAISIVEQNKKDFIAGLIPKLFSEENRKTMLPQIESLKALALQMSASGIIQSLSAMRDRDDKTNVLRKLDFPVHYILGDKDEIIPMELVRAQINASAKPTSTIIEGVGHMGFLESPEVVFESLKQFFLKCYPE